MMLSQVLVVYLCCFLPVTMVLAMVAPILNTKFVRLTMDGIKLALCLHFQRGMAMTISCNSEHTDVIAALQLSLVSPVQFYRFYLFTSSTVLRR